MKKIFYSMIAMAMAAMIFTSCENVPAPYEVPGSGNTETAAILKETFASSFGSFTVETPKGIAWVISHNTATATGYVDKKNTESESYLVSPEIDLTKVEKANLQFDYILQYANNEGADKVLITKNYTGKPAETQWEDITGTLTPGTPGEWSTFAHYAKNIDAKYLGGKCRIAFYYSGTAKGSRTWEIKNVVVASGEVEEQKEVLPSVTGTGEGTKDSPYNVEKATSLIAAKQNDRNAEVYVKGIITKVDSVSAKYHNATYQIADTKDGTNTLIIFGGLNLGKANFNNEKEVPVGSTVVVVGKLVEYKGLKEMSAKNYIYSVDGKTAPEKPDTPIGEAKGDGSEAKPFNVAGALAEITANPKDEKTATDSYVSGVVCKVDKFNKSYNSLTYYISDNGKNENALQIYSGLRTKDNPFKAATDLKVGDKVTVKGKLIDFKGTKEVAKNSIITKFETGSGTTTPDVKPAEGSGLTIEGTTVTLTNSKFTAGPSVTIDLSKAGLTDKKEVAQVALSDGSTIEFSKGTASTNAKFYTQSKGIRSYAGGIITFTGKNNIAKIVITCDNFQGANVGNADASVVYDGKKVVYTNSKTDPKKQIRLQTVTIYYAK